LETLNGPSFFYKNTLPRKMEMTKEKLKEICRKDNLYTADPSLNDKLYLHYKGFREISRDALERYTGLKVMWLEGNGLHSMDGLQNQKELTTLYLHENVIEAIEGLEECPNLDTLNISKNLIRKIEGLEGCTKLKVRSRPEGGGFMVLA
jgi:dynein assembly factor 1, axonemal